MDSSKLATAMLEWEKKRRELDSLEEVIKGAVLDLGKTQTVGNVRASYSKGRQRYKYDLAVEECACISEEIMSAHTKMVIDYRGVCLDAGLEVPFSQGAPSVSIKVCK